MPRTLKTLCALAALAALAPAPAPARNVEAPLAGTAVATTYTSSGAFHGAVDISGGTCGTTPITTAAVGSLAWTVVLNTPNTICYADFALPRNEVKHTFADGFTFRVLHFNPAAGSYSQTCDRCNIGKASSPDSRDSYIHVQHDRSGTRDTSWYAGYTVKGEVLDAGELIGAL